MSQNLHDTKKIQEVFTEYLKEQGLRKTTERYTILEHICHIRGHFDVETLLQRLESDNFHVSRASVYNTIELLVNAHLVVRHQFYSQSVQYEQKHLAVTHYHVICNYCGAVKEVKNDLRMKDMMNYRIPKFTQEYHSLYIYGICSKCKFKIMNKNKNKSKNSNTQTQ
ncbi:MAG: transcriptional repressor [Tannerella sp.]|jgi:Fur family ferric uptake transcriptional regulator|nr:transcriptional repressor [Tannerella sp.]